MSELPPHIEIHFGRQGRDKYATRIGKFLSAESNIEMVCTGWNVFRIVVDGKPVLDYKAVFKGWQKLFRLYPVDPPHTPAEIKAILSKVKSRSLRPVARHPSKGGEIKHGEHERQELFVIYGTYRAYLEHEDELINRRLSWNLTLQGFLFAAFGVIISNSRMSVTSPSSASDDKAAVEVLYGWARQDVRLLQWVIPLLGILVSSLSWIGVVAAQDAIDSLKEKWATIAASLPRENTVPLPLLTGGGRYNANRFGKSAQLFIPGAVIFAWLAMLLAPLTLLTYGWLAFVAGLIAPLAVWACWCWKGIRARDSIAVTDFD